MLNFDSVYCPKIGNPQPNNGSSSDEAMIIVDIGCANDNEQYNNFEENQDT